MDYVESFKNLKTNNKYSRKSPHKAVLLLSIIDMFESCILTDNVIKYDDALKSAFLKTWNKVLPNEATFLPEAYLPFWFMQSEGFWHIVPLRGKEDILSILRDTHVKPSESKLRDCVNYAELDEDLYFLMTLQSGRTSLRRALLENYTTLSTRMIEKLSSSKDNYIDNSQLALNEYESIPNSTVSDNLSTSHHTDKEIERQFFELPEDIQYILNIEYYTYLKNNVNEREMFKEICPTVYDLYDKIAQNPIRQGEIAHSIAFSYENFLADLKINLMSEEGAVDTIDKINEAIDLLHERESVYSSPVTCEKIEEPVLFEPDNSQSTKQDLHTPQKAFEKLDSPIVNDEEHIDFYVENNGNFCSIFNQRGERVYSTTGKLKIFHGKVYRFNYKQMCFTVKDIIRTTHGWDKGTKKLVAYSDSKLYPLLDKQNFIDQIEDFIEVGQMQFNKMSVDGKWYSFDGDFLGVNTSTVKPIKTEKEHERDASPKLSANYVPKGKLKDINEVVESSYDYLWLLAIIDFMGEKRQSASLSYDELACMMIANAWELLALNPSLKDKETTIVDCIEFLIDESKEYMDVDLDWNSSKEDVFEAIKDYPMAGTFEDTVDEMLENSPYNILKAWIKEQDEKEFIMFSIEYKNACLYAIHPRKIDPYIEINPSWKNSLFFEHLDLMQYFKNKYLDYLSIKNLRV